MANKVENPWTGMNGPNYYTENDKKIIEAFNEKTEEAFKEFCKKGNPHFIDIDLLPEPYMGNPKANIILLYSNPGISSSKTEKNEHKVEKFKSFLIKNLTHEPVEYPYYYLNPDFEETAGGVWIMDRIREIFEILLDEIKDKRKVQLLLSNNFFTLQLHPFHSREFQPINNSFSMDAYTIQLFMDAIERVEKEEALMICTRSYVEWNKVYQKKEGTKKNLEDIPNFIRTKNARSPYLTLGNLGEANFNKLIAKLKKSL